MLIKRECGSKKSIKHIWQRQLGVVLTVMAVLALVLGYRIATARALAAPENVSVTVNGQESLAEMEIDSGTSVSLSCNSAGSTILYVLTDRAYAEDATVFNYSVDLQSGAPQLNLSGNTRLYEKSFTLNALGGKQCHLYTMSINYGMDGNDVDYNTSEITHYIYTVKQLKEVALETNIGEALTDGGSSFSVMSGAKVYIRDYVPPDLEADTQIETHYKIYDSPVDVALLKDLSFSGSKYVPEKGIALGKTTGATRFLYIQQKRSVKTTENREESEITVSSYTIKFYPAAANPVLNTKDMGNPEYSDTGALKIKAGSIIRFAATAAQKLYCTSDGTRPVLKRVERTDLNPLQITEDMIIINHEAFVPATASTKLAVNNVMAASYEWTEAEGGNNRGTLTAINVQNGYDISAPTRFIFDVTQEQAKAPTISPATTQDAPAVVADGTQATLSTDTAGGTILYTEDGSVPGYSITVSGNGVYSLQLAKGTKEYTRRIELTGKPDQKLSIVAMTISVDYSTGYRKLRDSDPVIFDYKIAPLDKALAPTATPKSGTDIALNSKIYLNAAQGVLLYTTDGTTPSYTVEKKNGIYQAVPGGTTKEYGVETSYIVAEEPDAEEGGSFLIQAKVVSIDPADGDKLMEDSSVTQFSYKVLAADQVATPTAIPATSEAAPATVSEGDKILLNCTTAGAKIYYTMDGAAPVVGEDGSLSASTKSYDGTQGIRVPAGVGYLTITAVAVRENMRDSNIVQFVYQYPGAVSPPYATPVEGTVSINTQVTLASLDENAQIYYTLDGSEPTIQNARLYTAPVLLTQDTVIKAICVVNGVSSTPRTFTYYVAPELTAPTPSIASGAVVTSGTIVRLTAQNGSIIYYTTDGSNPKQDGAMSGSTVSIMGKAGDTVTVNAYAKGSNFSDSPVATYVYMISNYENGVKVNPEPGSKVKQGDTISLDTDVTDGIIYYATAGESPLGGGKRGNQVTVGNPGIDEKFTLKVTVVPEGAEFTNSIATFIYEYMDLPAAPKASIPSGAVLLEKQMIMLTAEEGDIYYTLDGSTPDEQSDIYTEPIEVGSEMTIEAVAISAEGACSEVAEFAYTFAEQTAVPQFSLKSGEVNAGETLTIRSKTEGAAIYYTTDGQVPDLNNNKNLYLYSGAITLTKPVNIKAVAVKDKMAVSEVVSMIYTVKEPEPVAVEEGEEEALARSSGGRLMSRRSYMNSSSGPTYSDFVLKGAMGVLVSADKDMIPAEAEIAVTETAVDDALNRAVVNSAGREYGAVSSYEVSLILNEEAVQPAGAVELGLPIPQEYRNSAIAIAYIDEEGNAEVYETRRDGDMAYAFIEHFSRYCVIAPVNLTESKSGVNPTVIAVVAGGLLLAGGYLFLRMGRKKNKEEEVSILD